MKRILLSLLTIGLVGGAASGATFAFFTDTQTLSSEVTTSGDLALNAVVTDGSGVLGSPAPILFAKDLRPASSDVRCLWIENPSTVPARFKLYRSAPEAGEPLIGNNTHLGIVLNPTTGDCSTATPPTGIASSTKYGAGDFVETGWADFMLRAAAFDDANTTPVRFLNTYSPLEPSNYLVFRVTSTLDSSVSSALAGLNYTSGLTLFGIQKEGSDADNLW